MVADRVRIVGGSGVSPPIPDPPPPPLPEGVDPLGYVQRFIDKQYNWRQTWYIQYPRDPSWTEQREYDGMYCMWVLSKLLANSYPSFSQLLFDRAVSVSDAWISVYPSYTSNPLASNILPDYQPPAYWRYNMGPRVVGQDPSCPAEKTLQVLTHAANFARTGCFGLYNWASFDNTWPSPTSSPSWHNPTIPPYACREWALNALAQMVMADVYETYEQRPWNERTWVENQELNVPRLVSHWFFGIGISGNACIDQWRAIGDQVAAASGDFTQVPTSWSTSSTGGELLPSGSSSEWCPFMFAHVCRMLIFYYEHPSDFSITGKPWGDEVSYKEYVLPAVRDLCDICIDWWQMDDAYGNNCLAYRIAEPGVMDSPGATDLGLWLFPMFAWTYSKTGQVKYKTMALDLIYAGLENGYFAYPKHINEQCVWVWHGFQWLGWTGTTFTIPWLAGGADQFQPLT